MKKNLNNKTVPTSVQNRQVFYLQETHESVKMYAVLQKKYICQTLLAMLHNFEQGSFKYLMKTKRKKAS